MTTPRALARLAALRGFAWSDEVDPTPNGDCPVLAPNGAELARLDVSAVVTATVDGDDDAADYTLFNDIDALEDIERTSLFEELEDTEIEALASVVSAPGFDLDTTLSEHLEIHEGQLARWLLNPTASLLAAKRQNRVELLADLLKELAERSDFQMPEQAATAIHRNRAVHDRLFRDFIRLAAFVAKANRGHLSFDTALIAACKGLLVALDRFEPTRGLKFTTYGTWWIRHHVGRARQDRGNALRVPVHVADRLSYFVRRERQRWAEDGERPDAAELVATLEPAKRPSDRDLEQLRTVARAEPHTMGVSLDPVGESIVDPTVLSSFGGGELSRWVGAALDELEGLLGRDETKTGEILRGRLAIGRPSSRTLREIGEDYRLSRERIRQIEEKALATLGKKAGARTTRPWDWSSAK